MGPAELDALVTRLLCDSTNFEKGVQTAINAVGAMAKQSVIGSDAQKTYVDELNKLGETMQKGATLTTSMTTSQEKYQAKVTELNKLLDAGVISHNTYNKALEQAKSQLGDIPSVADKAKMSLQGVAGSLSSIGRAAAGVGLLMSLDRAFNKFVEYEAMTRKLSAAIEVTGRTASSVIPEYEAFAEVMNRTTMLSKTQTMQMLTQAEMLGKSGETAKKAVKDASSLEAVTGQSAQSLVRATAAAEEGNYALLRRIPALRGVRDETELVTKYHRLLEAGERAEAAQAASTAGQLKKLSESFTGLTREIGGMVATVAGPLITAFRSIFDWFNSLGPVVKTLTASVIGLSLAFVAFGPMLMTVGASIASFSATVISSLGMIGPAIAANPVTVMVIAIGLAIAATIAAVYGLVKGTSILVGEFTGYNEQLERSIALENQRLAMLTKQLQLQVQLANVVIDPEERKDELEKIVSSAEKQIEELNAKVKSAKDRGRATGGPMSQDLSEDFQKEIKQYEEAKKRFEEQKKQAEAGIAQVGLPEVAMKKMIEQVKEMEKKHKLEFDTAGLTSAQKEAYKLEVQLDRMTGASPEVIAKAKEQIRQHLVEAQAYTTGTEMRKETHKIRIEMDEEGMTHAQKQIHKLQLEIEKLGDRDPAKLKNLKSDLIDFQNVLFQRDMGKLTAKYDIDLDKVGLTEAEKAVYDLNKDFKALGENIQDPAALAGIDKIKEKIISIDIKKLGEKTKDSLAQIGMQGVDKQLFAINKEMERLGDTKGADALRNKIGMLKEDLLALDVGKLTEKMKEQADTFFMSSTEAAVYKLKLQGLSDEQAKTAMSAQYLIDKLTDYKKIQGEGDKLTKEFQLPMEKYQEKLGDLNQALYMGTISYETYNRALQKAQAELNKTEKSAGATDAALSGSSEALRRVADFRAKLTVEAPAGPTVIANSTLAAAEQSVREAQKALVEAKAAGDMAAVEGLEAALRVAKTARDALLRDMAKAVMGQGGATVDPGTGIPGGGSPGWFMTPVGGGKNTNPDKKSASGELKDIQTQALEVLKMIANKLGLGPTIVDL